MKGHLKLLKSLDNKLNAAYASAQKSFAGRVLLKLTSEVILACLLAFAVYVATYDTKGYLILTELLKQREKSFFRLCR